MNVKYLFGAICILLCLMPMVFAGDLMVMHGKAYDGNFLMASGDVRVQVYNQASGGALLYDSLTDFNGAIVNGLFDILLGSGVPLDLNLGQNYYYAMQINAKDINFGISLRQVFQSSHGDLNIYPISQLINDAGYLVPSALTPYLTKVDANGFYAFKTDVNLWTNQLLVPYLSKVDANGFYALKGDVNVWTQQLLVPYATGADTNVWIVQKLAPYLLQVDANGFFAYKTDVNLWTNQLLVPYLLKTDANGFYAFKTDVNLWTMQLLVPYLLASDANGFYALKSDVNIWIGQLDTNWQTSWSVFDANIKNTYSTYFVTQTDGNIWYVKQTDGNAWYVKQIDGNAWYQLKADFNADLNNGISLQSCPPGFALNSLGTNFTCVGASGSDTNWQTSWAVFDANMKATYTQISDTNVWVNQLIFLAQQDSNQWTLTKLDGNALYALKDDVNVWTNQLMFIAQQDSNQWILTKLDANALYALKSDINTWIGQLDTNWQTSWGTLDANLRGGFVPYIGATADVNLGYNDLLVYFIKDLLNRNSISVNTRLLYDPDGNYALSWNTRSLSDEYENPSIQWGNRYLINSIGDIAAIWDTNFELYTSLIGNGHNITGINNFSATNIAGNLNWVYLQNYPTGCSAGQAIQALGDTLTCVDTNAYSVVTVDTNWVTSWTIFDANMKATYMLLGSDTNWQTSFGLFDANMKATYARISDVNTWANQLIVSAQIDSNKWSLTKVDANSLYALKWDINTWIGQLDTNWQTSWGTLDANLRATYTLLGDTNTWIDQKLVPYLSKADANGFYPLKTDVNIWAGQLDVVMEADANKWNLTKVDANGFYVLKTDANTWTTQLILTQQADSNKWTLTKVDANGFYTLKPDTNTWGNQLILTAQADSNKWSLTKLDANGFYALKGDVNVWIAQNLVPYLSKADANGFYALKSDVNTWGDQRYLKLTGGNITGSIVASQDINAKILKADTNIYVGTNVYMYDDGTALVIGRT